MITAHGLGNTIVGGDGINMIYGGDGQDIFTLPVAGQGFDDIPGFSETNGDILNLGPALLATSWDGSAGTLGNYLQVSNSNGATTLAIAADGTGSGTQMTRLEGNDNLGLSDLLSHGSLLT